MHSNNNFNIIQDTRNTWSVIEGQRMPGGYPSLGSKVLVSNLSRDLEIETADALQLQHD